MKIGRPSKVLWGVFAVLLWVLSASVQPSRSQPAQPAPVSGGKMVVGIASNLLHADASDSNDRYILEATQYFYESLFARDDSGKVIPWLVKSYGVSSNGLTYTFRLQPNVIFHDGTPFNAAAVKANLERKVSALDPARSLQRLSEDFDARLEVRLAARGENPDPHRP